MHLEGADSGHNDRAVGLEAAGSALDVHELLHANISPETGLMGLCQTFMGVRGDGNYN